MSTQTTINRTKTTSDHKGKKCPSKSSNNKKSDDPKKYFSERAIPRELSFRIAKRVTEAFNYKCGDRDYSFPICPACKITIEREFQSFCDRCGQKLDWHGFSYATCINRYPPYSPEENK